MELHPEDHISVVSNALQSNLNFVKTSYFCASASFKSANKMTLKMTHLFASVSLRSFEMMHSLTGMRPVIALSNTCNYGSR